MILLYIFGLMVYIALPFPLQILLLIINTVTPDPIPFIDEIIMYGGAFKKMMSFLDVISFFEEHEILAFIVKCLVVALIVFIVYRLIVYVM